MKTSNTNSWKPVCISLLAAFAAYGALADDSSATPTGAPVKSYTGTVQSLDRTEHVLYLKGWLGQRKAFNVGDNCAYSEPGVDNGPITSLRPGEKVDVSYQDRHGVLIADHVRQIPMRVEGTVTAIDPANHTLTVRDGAFKRPLHLADNCQIMLRDGKAGTFDDVKAGSYVTVTYETPGDVMTAREIAQTSIEFTGTLTAIDLEDRTVKAKTVFGTKRFHLGDTCAVVINGQPNGKLADLRPDEKVVVNYDEINGVNVVERIAPAEAGHVATATSPNTD